MVRRVRRASISSALIMCVGGVCVNVLCASFCSPQCSVRNYLQFVIAGRGC